MTDSQRKPRAARSAASPQAGRRRRAAGQVAHARELAILAEVARIATEDLALRPMLQRITDALAARVGCELVSLVRVDAEAGRFYCEALSASVPVDLWVGYSRELGSGVVGEVALTAQPIELDDVRTAANYVETLSKTRAELCVPVRHRGEVVALLNFESRKVGAFRGQLAFAEAIAGQLAGAISSARLFEQLRHRAAHLELLSEVSSAAMATRELSAVLAEIAEAVRRHFDLYLVAVVVANEEATEWAHRAFATRHPVALAPRSSWPVSAGMVGRAIRTGEPQLVLDVSQDPDYFSVDSAVRAELVVPIRSEGRILGAFNFENDDPAVFSAENQAILGWLAHQIAGAIQSALLNQRLSAATAALESANRQLSEANRALAHLSLSDALTGLANRRHFDETLLVEWRRLARAGEPLALLLVDVDCFKSYNDHYGHPSGDEALRQVARILSAGVQRAGDLAARYGGEEFALVLPGLSAGAAARIAEVLRARVEALAIPHARSTASEVLTLSVGVGGLVPLRDRAPEELVFATDKALYQAKRAGRNRVVSARIAEE